MELLLVIISITSYIIYSIQQTFIRNIVLFSILQVFTTLSITCYISVLSVCILFYNIYSSLHTLITLINVLSWFIYSINLPITLLQCRKFSYITSLIDTNFTFDCYPETKFTILSFFTFILWYYTLYIRSPGLIKYTWLLFIGLVVYNEIIRDVLVHFELLDDKQSRYTSYRVSNGYVLVKFNKIYIEY
jgi:hypothetical protein